MKLSKMQKDIINMVIQGKSNKEIGDALGYSPDNIKKILRTCFKYFKVKDRLGLVREALLTMYYNINS